MTTSSDSLRVAMDELASIAQDAGLNPIDARTEGLSFAAAIAESAPQAALDWGQAAALESLSAADLNEAFFEAASGGRKWRQAPTALLSELAATRSPRAADYAEALSKVAAAACLLGDPTPRVAGNATLASSAQLSAVPLAPRPGSLPGAAIPPAADQAPGPATPDPTPAAGGQPPQQPLPDPVLGVGDPDRISNLTELMLENQRRVHEQLAAIDRLRGGPMIPPGAGAGPADSALPPGPPAPGAGGPPTAPQPDAATAGEAQAVGEAQEAEQAPEKSLEELLTELDELIGLDRVKREIHQQVALLKVEKKRTDAGLKSATITRHLVFVGNPGTGKTTVARMVAGIYRALGLLSKGHLIEVDRSELVAGYLGQTAIKTSEVVGKAIGGVLFIDEAYGLNGDQYGLEAVNTLVKEMEDNRNDLVVIVAGYPDPMMEFIAQNPGLASRFKTIIEFADYTDDELMDIMGALAAGSDYELTTEARDVVREILAGTDRNFTFGNGRFVRNLLEEAIGRHAWRLRDTEEVSTEDLRRLLPEDFRDEDVTPPPAAETEPDSAPPDTAPEPEPAATEPDATEPDATTEASERPRPEDGSDRLADEQPPTEGQAG